MCGIFGAVFLDHHKIDRNTCRRLIRQLFVLSESRGKEASGFTFGDLNQITLMRAPVPASKLIRSKEFRDTSELYLERFFSDDAGHLSFVGHSRLVTDGERDTENNNQPVEKASVVGVHNGIVVNHHSLWDSNCHLTRSSDLDSEVIFSFLHSFSFVFRKKLSELLFCFNSEEIF